MRRPGIILLLLLLASPLSAQDVEKGQEIYNKWCVHCHAEDGSGEGVAASRVKPRPRDFTSGKYKVRMTTTGLPPTDDDIKLAIRRGLPYTSMPAFPENFIGDGELADLVAYLKSFSPDFEDPELQNPETITIPNPPPYDVELVKEEGARIYTETGCGRCHGNLGRGDGMSAPTLVDDWGHNIKVADLTKPWTFRGGGTREDIFRTMSTGFNGTPMPGFHNALGATPEESQKNMWAIVDYMLYLAGITPDGSVVEAPYANLATAIGTEDDLDISKGAELFQNAPPAMFSVVGQITEPGRSFYPSATAITVQAIYNDEEIAFLLRWNDMRAETTGTNGPEIQVPMWDEELAALGQGGSDSGSADEDEGDDFWGDDDDDDGAADAADADDFWGDDDDDDATDEGGDDFWGDDDDDGGAAGPTGPDTEFSDAVAIQFPLAMPTGIQRPYFIYGDAQKPVDLWFRDLGADQGAFWVGRGSAAVTAAESEPPETWTQYQDGEWSVIFKRRRKGRGTISFDEGTFVPIAFSVWDGFNRERGNKRGLTVWRNVYLAPREAPSWQGPVVRAGLGVLALEVFIIALVRRRKNRKTA